MIKINQNQFYNKKWKNSEKLSEENSKEEEKEKEEIKQPKAYEKKRDIKFYCSLDY